MANEYVKDMFDIWSCYMFYIKDGAAAGDYRPMVIIDWGEAKGNAVVYVHSQRVDMGHKHNYR